MEAFEESEMIGEKTMIGRLLLGDTSEHCTSAGDRPFKYMMQIPSRDPSDTAVEGKLSRQVKFLHDP